MIAALDRLAPLAPGKFLRPMPLPRLVLSKLYRERTIERGRLVTNDPWWNLLNQIVAVPYLAGLSPFFTGGIVLAVLLLVAWVLNRRRKRSGS